MMRMQSMCVRALFQFEVRLKSALLVFIHLFEWYSLPNRTAKTPIAMQYGIAQKSGAADWPLFAIPL